jgi:hypothetical protein
MKTPPPLSSELEALLAPHRTVLPLAPSVEARAIARASATTELPEPAAGRLPSQPRWVFAVAAGAVIAVGAAAAARAWIGVPSSRVPTAAQVAPIASPREPGPRAVVAAPPDTEALATIVMPEAPPRRHVISKTGAATVAATNAELQLLRDARQDVTRGDFARALATIAEHVRRFRHGSLVEEREALRVKSLAGLGRHAEAQRAAAEFHARFPHSVFLSTFERMKQTDR